MLPCPTESRHTGLRPPLPRPVGILLILAGACGAPAKEVARDAAVVTTMRGDTVVVHVRGAAEVPMLRLMPRLRIGDAEGQDGYEFANIAAVVPTRTGGAYVWDDRLAELREFDSTGRFVRRIGARGGGPGEYQGVSGLALVDDTLVLWDRYAQRASAYVDGAFVRSWRPAFPDPPTGELYAGGTHRVFLRHNLKRPDSLGAGRTETGYIGYSALGVPTGDTIPQVRLPTEKRYELYAEGPRGMRVQNMPFAPEAIAVLSPKGYLVTATTDIYSLLFHRPHQPLLRIERETLPVPIGDTERKDEEERITTVMRAVDPHWDWPNQRIPPTKPRITRVLFSTEGRALVQRAEASTRVTDESPATTAQGARPPRAVPPRRWRERHVYDVYEPYGEFLGTFALPEHTTFLSLDGNSVWGVERDDLDVPYVVRWDIEPPLPPSASAAVATHN